jgi:glycerophosphoryl diester phosphodiesterase
VPENTLPAFQRAVDLGYRYLETDVHVTADGVVVAFHDDDLSRTCGRPGLIHELPWSEVATARVDGKEPIPRLVDLLRTFPNARINIDCKTDGAVEALGDVLAEERVLDRVCVAGFSDRRLIKLRRRFGPDLCTSAGPVELGVLKFVGIAPPGVLAAQVPIDLKGFPVVTSGFVRKCHLRGVEVHVWTVDDAAEMARLFDLGVDGIMTDHPAVLKDVLSRRDQWVG